MTDELELSLTLSDAFNKDRSTIATIDGDDVFIKIYNPALRMVIIGAVHIAQPLSTIAGQLGFHVTVSDAREAFTTVERFPDADRVLVEMKKGRNEIVGISNFMLFIGVKPAPDARPERHSDG